MIVNYKMLDQNIRFITINVHGPISTKGKREQWANISNWLKLQNDTKSIIGGDFNATLDNSEKQGGLQAIIRVQSDFENFVEENQLRDIQTKNGRYTWTNGRKGFPNISKRLDRFLLSGD